MDQNNMQGAIDEDQFDELDPNGLIGVIKIKDGLFICDELGAQVSAAPLFILLITTSGRAERCFD